MPITTSTFAATGALDPQYYRERFVDSAANVPMVYPLVFKQIASDRKIENFSTLAGFQKWTTKGENSDIDFQTPEEAYTQSFTSVTYASGFAASREAIEDQQYREIEQWAEDLGYAGMALIETTAANILNRAFSNTYTFGDGKELCATDHPLKITAGTEQNEPSSANDFGYTALEQTYIDMAATTDDAGKLSPYKPDVIVVAPSGRVTAAQVLGSTYTSSALQLNVFTGQGLSLVVWDYLTDADAYFAIDKRHKLYFMWRRPVMFERWADYKAQSENYAGSMRFSCGPATWRGVYGSPGAG